MNDLIQDVYDHLMQNTNFIQVDFVNAFPESWIDCDEGVIHLAQKVGVSLFEIRLTTKHEARL